MLQIQEEVSVFFAATGGIVPRISLAEKRDENRRRASQVAALGAMKVSFS
jgi:hypothetical protein